ncbi:MAG: OB-fold nucleic acid binding domain-containing protein [Candidatus Anstonellales archaeon]
MKISELKANRNATVEGKVVSKDEPTEVTTMAGKVVKVANAVLQDETGRITLVLWAEDAERIKKGDRVRVENGWVSEYGGILKLSAGRSGKIIKL